MPINREGSKVYRTKTIEAENAYKDIKVISKGVSVGLEILVSTSQFENIKLTGQRQIVVEGNLTDEQEYEIHKDLFLDCAADIVSAGHMVFKQWNRLPRSGWPPKLGEKISKIGHNVSMDEVSEEGR
jgi:hypothetical protein